MAVVKGDLEELFESVMKALGDREIIAADLDVGNGMTEVTPKPRECIAGDLAAPEVRSFVMNRWDGTRTITLVLKAAKKVDRGRQS